MSYKCWYITNQNKNILINDRFVALIEDYIKNTTKESPKTVMPDGKYAGKPISEIPMEYLRWYYKKTSWNETNDSLKRGIELKFRK